MRWITCLFTFLLYSFFHCTEKKDEKLQHVVNTEKHKHYWYIQFLHIPFILFIQIEIDSFQMICTPEQLIKNLHLAIYALNKKKQT